MTHTRTVVGHPARLSGFSSRLPAVSNDTSRRRAEPAGRWGKSVGGGPVSDNEPMSLFRLRWRQIAKISFFFFKLRQYWYYRRLIDEQSGAAKDEVAGAAAVEGAVCGSRVRAEASEVTVSDGQS